jgi:hypothetical protein
MSLSLIFPCNFLPICYRFLHLFLLLFLLLLNLLLLLEKLMINIKVLKSFDVVFKCMFESKPVNIVLMTDILTYVSMLLSRAAFLFLFQFPMEIRHLVSTRHQLVDLGVAQDALPPVELLHCFPIVYRVELGYARMEILFLLDVFTVKVFEDPSLLLVREFVKTRQAST